MAVTRWLIDTSALAKLGASDDVDLWLERLERGLVSISTVTRLEVGYSARSGAEGRREARDGLLGLMPIEYMTPAAEDRAAEVQLLLADRGQHRAPSVADLLVAATAEIAGLLVLHVDKDFELIAEVTGQPVERLRLR